MMTHEDVELAAEAVGDVAEQVLTPVPHGEVADGDGDALTRKNLASHSFRRSPSSASFRE